MSIAISSLGVRVYYTVAADTSAPVSATTFTEVPEVKSIPSLSPAPDTLETTPLANTEYKTYINGLKDLGGALEFTVNLTQDLIDLWNGRSYVLTSDSTVDASKTYYTRDGVNYTVVTSPEDAGLSTYYEYQDASTDADSVMYKFAHLTSGNAMWLCIVHPQLSNAVYFPFEPAKLGLPEITVNAVLEGTLSITPVGEVTWDAKPVIG